MTNVYNDVFIIDSTSNTEVQTHNCYQYAVLLNGVVVLRFEEYNYVTMYMLLEIIISIFSKQMYMLLEIIISIFSKQV